MTTLYDAHAYIEANLEKPRDATAKEVAAYLVWIALRRGVFLPANAVFKAQGIFSGGELILEMPGYGQSQTVTCEILGDDGEVLRTMPLPVDKRGKLPMTVAQAKEWTGLAAVKAPRKSRKPVVSPAQPAAAAVEELDVFEAHDRVALAALAAIDNPVIGNPDVDAVWFRYVAGIIGADREAGPRGWAIETGRKQYDRKQRNRGVVLISHDAFAMLRDRFNDLPPFQHAPALPCEVEPAAVEVVPAAAAPSDDLAATVAQLLARVAALETGAAPAPAARPARTAAHLRAIRAYLKIRAERTALRAAAVERRHRTARRLVAVRGALAQARTNEAAVRQSVQVQAREAMRLQGYVDQMRDDVCAAEVATLEARAALTALETRAAADRAELERLAPVVSALAALNRPAPAAVLSLVA